MVRGQISDGSERVYVDLPELPSDSRPTLGVDDAVDILGCVLRERLSPSGDLLGMLKGQPYALGQLRFVSSLLLGGATVSRELASFGLRDSTSLGGIRVD